MHPITTTFAVPLHCDACIHALRALLSPLPEIHALAFSLPAQTLTITGSAPPSRLAAIIRASGRAAILRGAAGAAGAAAAPDPTATAPPPAAVAILESYGPAASPSPVRGLVRIVRLGPDSSAWDVALSGVEPGTYGVAVRRCGDVSGGVASVGGVWGGEGGEGGEARGWIGRVVVEAPTAPTAPAAGSLFVERAIDVSDVLGRAVAAVRCGEADADADALVGVVARSAGLWDNEKTVCSCSGKTVWEEGVEMGGRGML